MCVWGGGSPISQEGLNMLKSAFNHSWSYHQLQVGFGGACKVYVGVGVLSLIGPVLHVPNNLHDLHPTVFEATDPILPQVSRNVSLRPLY